MAIFYWRCGPCLNNCLCYLWLEDIISWWSLHCFFSCVVSLSRLPLTTSPHPNAGGKMWTHMYTIINSKTYKLFLLCWFLYLSLKILLVFALMKQALLEFHNILILMQGTQTGNRKKMIREQNEVCLILYTRKVKFKIVWYCCWQRTKSN